MADCLVYSTNGPVLGNGNIEGPKSDTVPALRELTFITVHLHEQVQIGTLQIFREFLYTELHVILVITNEELK